MADAVAKAQQRKDGFEIRRISVEAPWSWLAAGWRDLRAAPALSLGYGLVFTGGGIGLSALLFMADLAALIPVLAAGFALLGPLLALGLYEASRRRAKGAPLHAKVFFGLRARSGVHLLYLGLFLLFGFMIWLRVAQLLYALFIEGSLLPVAAFGTFLLTTPGGLSMLVIGTLTGGLIAGAIFALAWVSAPLLVDQDTDVFTAMSLSLAAFRQNFQACVLWAFLIAVMVSLSIATLFAGLIVVFPWLGHASWHAYRDTIGVTEGGK